MQRHDAAGERLPVDASEAGPAYHVRECSRLWKFADGLDEISIRLGVARDRAAELRDDVEGEEIVEPVKTGHLDRGKFKREKSPTRLQHAIGFLERGFDPRHVADAESDGVAVESAVGKRKRLGI